MPKKYIPKGKYERICDVCGAAFVTHMPKQIYCSRKCRYSAAKGNTVPSGLSKEIPSGSIGALTELYVAFDLMTKGYEVYRALSPSSYSDLIAIKNGQIQQLEVRSGTYKKDKLTYITKKIEGKLLAVVTMSDRKIHYLFEV